MLELVPLPSFSYKVLVVTRASCVFFSCGVKISSRVANMDASVFQKSSIVWTVPNNGSWSMPHTVANEYGHKNTPWLLTAKTTRFVCPRTLWTISVCRKSAAAKHWSHFVTLAVSCFAFTKFHRETCFHNRTRQKRMCNLFPNKVGMVRTARCHADRSVPEHLVPIPECLY